MCENLSMACYHFSADDAIIYCHPLQRLALNTDKAKNKWYSLMFRMSYRHISKWFCPSKELVRIYKNLALLIDWHYL